MLLDVTISSDVIIYALAGAVSALAIYITVLIKNDKKDRKEMSDKAFDAMNKNTDILASLKTMLETTREKR